MEMKDKAALTALRDELRKVFEPYGARIDQFEIQLSDRSLRWRSWTPDYPAHHIGGAFEELRNLEKFRLHRVIIVIMSDEHLLGPDDSERYKMLFEARWMPERIFQPNIWNVIQSFGIELIHPIITVLPVKGVWNSK
jgi:hypothetical protein